MVLGWITNPELNLVRFVKRRVDGILHVKYSVKVLGCFIISLPPIFLTRTHSSDGILDADFEFDIIFYL